MTDHTPDFDEEFTDPETLELFIFAEEPVIDDKTAQRLAKERADLPRGTFEPGIEDEQLDADLGNPDQLWDSFLAAPDDN